MSIHIHTPHHHAHMSVISPIFEQLDNPHEDIELAHQRLTHLWVPSWVLMSTHSNPLEYIHIV